MPRPRADATGAAGDAIMVALLAGAPLTLNECADVAGVKTRRAGVILYAATQRGHVDLHVDRRGVHSYTITARGRAACELLRVARDMLTRTNPFRARRAHLQDHAA